jgi:hypothetical protein
MLVFGGCPQRPTVAVHAPIVAGRYRTKQTPVSELFIGMRPEQRWGFELSVRSSNRTGVYAQRIHRSVHPCQQRFHRRSTNALKRENLFLLPTNLQVQPFNLIADD